MIIIPAIDVLGGRAVRLLRGDYERETVYGDDPVAVARGHAQAGAARIHVVDLDAARGGSDNRELVTRIVREAGVSVQVAGGVRSQAAVEAWMAAGAAAVVMGTAAVRDPALLDRCAALGPVLGALDVREGRPAVTGWTQAEPLDLDALLERWSEAPLAGVIVTAIDRDGTLAGPDLGLLRRTVQRSRHAVTYSGGIGTIGHLEQVSAAGAGAVILGKALYEGRFRLQDAISAG